MKQFTTWINAVYCYEMNALCIIITNWILALSNFSSCKKTSWIILKVNFKWMNDGFNVKLFVCLEKCYMHAACELFASILCRPLAVRLGAALTRRITFVFSALAEAVISLPDTWCVVGVSRSHNTVGSEINPNNLRWSGKRVCVRRV